MPQTARRVAVVLANLPQVAAPLPISTTRRSCSQPASTVCRHLCRPHNRRFPGDGTVPSLPDGLPPLTATGSTCCAPVLAAADAGTVGAVPDATRATVAALQSETRHCRKRAAGNRQIVNAWRTDAGLAAVTGRLAADNPLPHAAGCCPRAGRCRDAAPDSGPAENRQCRHHDTLDAAEPNAAPGGAATGCRVQDDA